MDRKVIWKSIDKDNGSVKMPFVLCQKCNKEFNNGNVFASNYCPDCASIIKKEKTRERVRRFRQGK